MRSKEPTPQPFESFVWADRLTRQPAFSLDIQHFAIFGRSLADGREINLRSDLLLGSKEMYDAKRRHALTALRNTVERFSTTEDIRWIHPDDDGVA